MSEPMNAPTAELALDRYLAEERAAGDLAFGGSPNPPSADRGPVTDEEWRLWHEEMDAYRASCDAGREAARAAESARWDAAWAAGLDRPE